MRRLKESEGQGIVELAIILPFLLVLVLGIVQYGLFFGNYQSITDATRVVARTASLCVNGTTTPNAAGLPYVNDANLQASFSYAIKRVGAGAFSSAPNFGNRAPNCTVEGTANGTALASGDQIKVTGQGSPRAIKLVFYSFNLTPKSTTTVVVP